MKIAVVGGGLQGVEICMLAKKAGWKIVLIDKLKEPLAVNLCNEFIQFDIEKINNDINAQIKQVFVSVDIVIPALENLNALNVLIEYCRKNVILLAFDEKAYAITSSKIKSRDFFRQCKTPIPVPACEQEQLRFPLIAKPSVGSGSQGVRLLHNEQELYAYLPDGLNTPDWIVESYCSGRQFSMEVCGVPGKYTTFQLTELFMDDVFDCCGVTSPVNNSEFEQVIKAELLKLAEKLQLRGIMDIEAVIDNNKMHVFEIDARFPSQTPLTVYYSSGVNLLEHFVACFMDYQPVTIDKKICCAGYFHVARNNDMIFYPGEHSLSQAGPLRVLQEVPGVQEVLIGGSLESKMWSAVLFVEADSIKELEQKKKIALDFITQ